MAKFETVYCPNLNQEISAEDYIAYRENHTEPLTLLCPDEECRHDCPDTRMHARGCDPNTIYKVAPYFATNPNNEHSENCSYTIVSPLVKDIIKNRKLISKQISSEFNLLRKFNNQFANYAFDEFTFAETPNYNVEVKTKIRLLQNPTENNKRRCCCTTARKTHSLAALVDYAYDLNTSNKDDFETAQIKVPPRENPCSYDRLFLPIFALKSAYKPIYIVFGEFEIINNDGTYYAISTHPIKYYNDDNIERYVVIKIIRENNTPSFMKDIKNYFSSKKNGNIYCFGKHYQQTISPDLVFVTNHLQKKLDSCIILEPLAPNCMVIRDFAIK